MSLLFKSDDTDEEIDTLRARARNLESKVDRLDMWVEYLVEQVDTDTDPDAVTVTLDRSLAEEFVDAGFIPHTPPITDVQTLVKRELNTK